MLHRSQNKDDKRGSARGGKPAALGSGDGKNGPQRLSASAARESHRWYRLILYNVRDFAIFSADVDGNVSSWNPGAQAIDYLQGRGPYSDRVKFPMPKLLLLDLRMPRMNGLELLQWLREPPEFLRNSFSS